MQDAQKLTQALSHVLWIAGSPCAGKSTIGHTIARTHVFLDYRFDPMERNHIVRSNAENNPALMEFLAMDMGQRWLLRSPEDMAENVIRSWTARFRLVIEDLLALPNEPLMVAEGNFFPESLAPYLSSPHQAIWLVPTDAFCEQIRRRRRAEQVRRQQQHGVYQETSDAERRLHNLIERDWLLARYVKQQAEERHLPIFEVDGSRSLDEMTALVEKHFEPYIIERLRQMKRW